MTKDKGLFSYASQEICSDSLTVIITPETSSDTTYKATLYYQTDHPYEYVIPEDITKSYLPHEWKTAPAVISKLDGGQLAASAKLPDNVSYFYMEISVDANGKKYVISSSFHIKDV